MSEPTITMCDGDVERIKRILDTGDVSDALTEIMRSRGALLRFALRVAANEDAPEYLRNEARIALDAAPLRMK
jgi:hypothetical protein